MTGKTGVSGGCWPTGEQALLLRAALLHGHEAITAWQLWARAVDIDTLDGASVRLLPHLYRTLEREGVRDELRGRLKGMYRHTWYANHLRLRDTALLVKTLQEQGVEALLLKGAALTLLYYRDPGLWPMDDVDVLVRTDQAQAAVAALSGNGWRPRSPVTANHVESHHAMDFADATGQRVDLHWHVLPENCGRRADDAFWDRSRRAEVRGVPVRVLDPTDQLFHVCAHGVKWEPIRPLRWIADAAVILARAGAELDWARLARETRQRRLVLPVREALAHLASTLALPVPGAVLSELGAAAVSRAEQWEHRLRTRPAGRVLGRVPEHWLRYRRLRADRKGEETIGFIGYLQLVLGCQGVGQLAGRALFRHRYRRHAQLTTQQYERELKRSALL